MSQIRVRALPSMDRSRPWLLIHVNRRAGGDLGARNRSLRPSSLLDFRCTKSVQTLSGDLVGLASARFLGLLEFEPCHGCIYEMAILAGGSSSIGDWSDYTNPFK